MVRFAHGAPHGREPVPPVCPPCSPRGILMQRRSIYLQLLFLFGLTLAAGLFFILLDVLRLPYLSTAKAMLNTTRAEKKAARSFETYLMTFAVKLSRYIRMDEYRKHRLKNVLKATGMNMEPEIYQ